MVVHEVDAALFARIQERNLIRQYNLLANCIEIGIQKGPEALDKYTLWALNHVAERIREDRAPYVQALRAADRAWDAGNLNVSELDGYLARLLQDQLAEAEQQRSAAPPPHERGTTGTS